MPKNQIKTDWNLSLRMFVTMFPLAALTWPSRWCFSGPVPARPDDGAGYRPQLQEMEEQAKRALAAGREDLAAGVLERKQAVQSQLTTLEGQIATSVKEQEKLAATEARLSAKLEAFRTRKEVVKAQYSAAEAQVKIGEAVTGISEEMADVGMALERAREKTENMRARAAAIDELTKRGLLEDPLEPGDPINRELDKITAAQNVQVELHRLKKEMQQEGAR